MIAMPPSYQKLFKSGSSSTTRSRSRMNSNLRGRRQLPPDFRPGPLDVLCARGKHAFDHEGTKRFRALVKLHAESYANCDCKYEKSRIVSRIVRTVRERSPQGGFVKYINGVWWEVGDRTAKEKIGQTFRDTLHDKYTSSTKAKAKARIAKRQGFKRSIGQEDLSPSDTSSQTLAMSSSLSEAAVATVGDRSMGLLIPLKTSSDTGTDEYRSSVSVVSQDEDEDEDDGLSPSQTFYNPGSVTATAPSSITVVEISPKKFQHTEATDTEPSLYETLRDAIESLDSCSDLEPLPLVEETARVSDNTRNPIDFVQPDLMNGLFVDWAESVILKQNRL